MAEVVEKEKTNYYNKRTRNYPSNPLRPLEISQATYETLLLIYMNDMGESDGWFLSADTKVQNNEYLKALGTFILGEPIGDYLWPSNWLRLLHDGIEDVKLWHKALNKQRIDKANKQFVGNVIEALTKRTVLQDKDAKFKAFLDTPNNPVNINYANKEAGSQKAFPSALTTRRVLEALIIPYRTSVMDCNPRNPASNIDALTKWYNKIDAAANTNTHSTAFISSMIDFYKANIFPDPELFLPYMIALSPSIRNAQLAIEEYKKFVTDEVAPLTTDDCCDPFLKFLFGKQIPSIPNFEKNYLLLAEKFNTNRDYLKVSVGPIIENMVLPIAVDFGIFRMKNASEDLQKRRILRAQAQRKNAHNAFSKQATFKDLPPIIKIRFWHAYFKDLVFSYQNPTLFYFPHWLYSCTSRYIKADASFRDRDFVVINIENPRKRAYLVRWCNIKNFLTRDSCDFAVLMAKVKDDTSKVNKMHIMSFQDYIQMIPRPQVSTGTVLGPLEIASFTNCFEKVCAPNTSNLCLPRLTDSAPLPELPT